MKKILLSLLGLFLVLAVLFGGVVYSRFQREGLAGLTHWSKLLSQSVPATPEKVAPVKETPTMTREQITSRISQIEKEILKTTNDPDRDIQLRTELFSLRAQLEVATQ